MCTPVGIECYKGLKNVTSKCLKGCEGIFVVQKKRKKWEKETFENLLTNYEFYKRGFHDRIIYPLPLNRKCLFCYYPKIFNQFILEYNQIKTNLHPVRIYFETSTFEAYKKDSKLTFVNKISTIGGIIGFWNGFCILSFVEIIHYATLAMIRCFGYQDNDNHLEDSDSVSSNFLKTFC